MKLGTYLTENDISTATFAEQVGVNAETVRTWLKGMALPRREALARIRELTKGAVRPDDFVPQDEAAA